MMPSAILNTGPSALPRTILHARAKFTGQPEHVLNLLFFNRRNGGTDGGARLPEIQR